MSEPVEIVVALDEQPRSKVDVDLVAVGEEAAHTVREDVRLPVCGKPLDLPDLLGMRLALLGRLHDHVDGDGTSLSSGRVERAETVERAVLGPSDFPYARLAQQNPVEAYALVREHGGEQPRRDAIETLRR